MRRGFACLFALCMALAALPMAMPRSVAGAAIVPAGFNDTLFASGFGGRLDSDDLGPGARLFVSEKQGSVRIVENGILLDEPFLTITTNDRFGNG